MTKSQALYNFWAGFGIPALDEQSAYDEQTLEELQIGYPYLSFESAVGEFGEPVALSADLWYRSTTWRDIEAKAEQIANAIGLGGVTVPYDDGVVWITRGSPIYRRLGAENIFDIRRIQININAEFLSA